MDQNTFEVNIDYVEKFAKEVFASCTEEKFQVRLMEKLDQIMKLGKSQKMKLVPSVKSMESNPCKKMKLDKDMNIDFPNEIWSKIIRYLTSEDVYQNITLVSKRFQSLALDSGVLRVVNLEEKIDGEKMNFLKNSNIPMKFIYELPSIYENDKLRAISVAQNLKSLVIRHAFVGEEFQIQDTAIINAIKDSKSRLEHIELSGCYMPSEFIIEISKIKTLKTFKISKVSQVVITPEVVNAFAKNESQLENIEFNQFNPIYGHINVEENNKLNNALNNLLEKKSNTLKSLKYINWDYMVYSTVPLTNLKLCHKVEEFCGGGGIPEHDIEILAKLPRLKKLKLLGLDNPKYLLDHLNLDYLKYLSINGERYLYQNEQWMYEEVSKHYYPNLQRLHLDVPGKLGEEFFSNLISNAPNLKSIHLHDTECSVSHEFMHDFCKNSNIFVSFNSQSFEDFLLEKYPLVFVKYKRLEKSFKEWSSNNLEYSNF